MKIANSRNWFLFLLLGVAILLAFLAPKAAVNVDEQLHYPHAKKVVNWYFTGGEDVSSLQTPLSNLKYYGQSVDNLSALINRVFNIEDEFLTRHYTGAFFFLILLLFAGLIAFEIGGLYQISIITVFVILFMPRFFGQAFGNLKDIPFAAGYLASIYFIIRFFKQMPKASWLTAVWLGLAIAFTCSVRIGGLILPIYFALFSVLFIILKPFVPKQNVSTKPCLVRLLGQGIVITSIAYFVGLLFWPFALQDVFRNPLASLQVMEHYKVNIRQIFNGELIWSSELPWYYLPKWLVISTPEFVWLGFLYFFIRFVSQPKNKLSEQLFLELFLFFSLLFPLFYVVTIKANLYSGVRQLLFILPPLAILSVLGWYHLFLSIKKKYLKFVVLATVLVLLFLPFQHQLKTFPADYIYFNTISGGNKKAWSNYEYDYYFHGIKTASDKLKEIIQNKKVIVAGNSNLSNYFEKSENIVYKYSPYLERSSLDWDYGIFGINYIHPEMLKNGKWFSTQTQKVFFHKGNPIAVLLKRTNKSDFDGLKLMEQGEFEQAKILLVNAIKTDPNNVWIYSQLAKIALKEKDFNSFSLYLQKGREIYPSYEPFYLLEATYFFEQEDFIKANETLSKLIEINNRYKPAKKLFLAVKEKLK